MRGRQEGGKVGGGKRERGMANDGTENGRQDGRRACYGIALEDRTQAGSGLLPRSTVGA